jgi:predicted nucleic acid-binding protein
VGLIVLDAGVVIGFVDPNDAHHVAARQVLHTAASNRDSLALPMSAFAEVLVNPARSGAAAVEEMRSSIAQLGIALVSLEEEVAVVSAELRARSPARLRLPDALVIATAIVLEADTLVTTERGWPAAEDLGFDGELIRL